MVRRPTPTTKRQAELTPGQIRSGIERLTKRLEEVHQFEPASVTDQFNIPHVERLSAAIDESLVRTFGADSADSTVTERLRRLTTDHSTMPTKCR